MAKTKQNSTTLENNKKSSSGHRADKPRDELGQFSSGSVNLSVRKFKWKRLFPVVIVVALVGGFLVYRSFGANSVIALPGVTTSGRNDCRSAGGNVLKETTGSKRNASVCELSSTEVITPVIFSDGRGTSSTVAQLNDLTSDRMSSTGYFEVCYNIRRVGSSAASVAFGGYTSASGAPGAGTTRTISDTEYQVICDPVAHRAGSIRPFLRVASGNIRLSSIALNVTSEPSTPPPPDPVEQVAPGVSFFWPIGGAVNINEVRNDAGAHKVVDFDSFSASNATSIISQLKALGNVHVVCYFSAGTAEDWRSDYSRFTTADKSNQLDNWEGEYILDTRSSNVRNIMADRIRTMKSVGCDGVEPDNVDGYSYNSGFPLTKATALNYLDFLQKTAHDNGMTIALKNSAELVDSNLPSGAKVTEAFDWALIEECYHYNECDDYRPFVQAGKAAVIVEYGSRLNCSDANSKNYDAYRMNLSLNGNVRTACRTL